MAEETQRRIFRYHSVIINEILLSFKISVFYYFSFVWYSLVSLRSPSFNVYLEFRGGSQTKKSYRCVLFIDSQGQ